MKKITYMLVGLFLAFCMVNLLGSCEISNPAEGIPAIIRVDSADLSVTSSQGTADQIIRDVYLTVGTEFVGAFPMPAKMPVLQSGEVDVAIDFGIVENGIAGLRAIYPFWERETMSLNLVPGETIDLGTMTASYLPSTNLDLMQQDFDSGASIVFETLIGAPLSIAPSEEAFEGNSRRVRLDSIDAMAVVASTPPYLRLSETPSQIFMELNYKSDINMEVWLLGYDANDEAVFGGEQAVLGLSPRDTWGKVYINLGPTVALLKTDSQVNRFQVFFRGDVSSSTPERFYLYFDNIKVLRLRQ